MANIAEEFKKRGVKIIALSVNSVDDHEGWIADINKTQNAEVGFPLVADPERKVAQLYDMIHPNALDNIPQGFTAVKPYLRVTPQPNRR